MHKNNGIILGVGEVLLRLSTSVHSGFSKLDSVNAHYGGAEYNVILSLSQFGNQTRFYTCLPNNQLGYNVQKELLSHNVDIEEVTYSDGRLGLYFAEIGYGYRKTKIIYDRQYSTFSGVTRKDMDYNKLFNNVYVMHVTGITAALNKEMRNLTRELILEAKQRGVLVSYDSNYRSKLWSQGAAGEFLKEILPYVDIAFLGDLDISNLLNIYSNKSDYKSKLEDLYKKVINYYPNIRYIASTKRTSIQVHQQELQGYIYTKGQIMCSQLYSTDVLDRVGTGDAFVAGVLHGIINHFDTKQIIEFAMGSGIWKHSICGDVNHVSEEEILELINTGQLQVNR